jgi:hypothetical protein
LAKLLIAQKHCHFGRINQCSGGLTRSDPALGLHQVPAALSRTAYFGAMWRSNDLAFVGDTHSLALAFLPARSRTVCERACRRASFLRPTTVGDQDSDNFDVAAVLRQ